MKRKPFFAWRPHPWHGLDAGPDPPRLVHAFVEITPLDAVKYEVDKRSGYLRVDRPQRTSSLPPTLYGFIPRTYCGSRVGALAGAGIEGDRDPLDICVLTERPILRAEILLVARVVGGLLMLDGGKADDKLVAVLVDDAVWSGVQDIEELPAPLVARLRHYFATYKSLPDEPRNVEIRGVYDHEQAWAVVEAALADYREIFADAVPRPGAGGRRKGAGPARS